MSADVPTPGSSSDEPAPPSFLERYGPPALASLFGLIILETAILTPLIHYGVDLAPVYTWIDATFGVDVAPEETQPGWILSFFVAWAIRRPLKPIEFAVAAAITPFVAMLPWFTPEADEA